MLEEVLIVPIGDLQYGSAQCDFDRFRRHVEWAAAQPNAYFLSMGDMVDLASPSNRGKLKAALADESLYDTVEDALDEIAEQHLQRILDVLLPTRGRWLGFLAGHHFWTFQDGTTSDQRLAQAMEAPFLGYSSMVEVRFKPRSEKRRIHRKPPSFVIWAHHGHSAGTSQLQSAPINRLEHIVKAFEADVYLVGHYHKKVAAKLQRLALQPTTSGKPKLVYKNLILACTGSFLKGYEEGAGGYAEQRMLTPTALGGVVIWARPRFDREGYATVDLDVSL